jgi:Kef-type K+ transport system membrane component KefB
MPVEISSVLVYLAVFLIAAKLGGLLAARIKQPAVFGELLFGILLGPSVAGWVSQQLGLPLLIDPNASVFSGFISPIADVGIILLLFLAGLSIDVDELKAAGRASTVVATTGVIAAFTLGFGVAFLCGWTSLQAAFVGAVLAATSVGIAVRTLVDINRLHTRVGMTILGAAVIDDVIGIMILSVLAGLAHGSVPLLELAKDLSLIAIFFIAAIYIGLKLVPRVITYIDKLPVEEMALSVALALAFIMGALAEEVRLAAITGAFVAGIIMSRATIAGSLRGKISTIGYGLFIPMFFVGMGVQTNLGALTNVGLLALALVIVAMFDKIVGCGVGALLGGFGWKDSLRVGAGMMPRAEVALVVASIGVKTGILPTDSPLFSITVMIVLVTSLVTPLLVKLAFRGT